MRSGVIKSAPIKISSMNLDMSKKISLKRFWQAAHSTRTSPTSFSGAKVKQGIEAEVLRPLIDFLEVGKTEKLPRDSELSKTRSRKEMEPLSLE